MLAKTKTKDPGAQAIEDFRAGAYEAVLISPIYPDGNKTYGGEFIHRRVLKYLDKEFRVGVIHVDAEVETAIGYSVDGVPVLRCSLDHLQTVLNRCPFPKVMVHFISPKILKSLEPHLDRKPTFVWVHGFEVRNPYRLAFNFSKYQLVRVCIRAFFRLKRIRKMVSDPRIKKIYVSNFLKSMCEEDTKAISENFVIIPNHIDEEVFSYQKKEPAFRKKVLLIRSFAAKNYANDLAVEAIIDLREDSAYDDMTFTIIGTGKLFEKTVRPLKTLKNVRIQNQYLTPAEIAEQHRAHGVLLCPSRFDTQGVTLGEGMSSGLVPVTNAVAAIPEYLDESSGILAPPESGLGLSNGLKKLYDQPHIFEVLSQNAAARAKEQCGYDQTIGKELKLLGVGDFAK